MRDNVNQFIRSFHWYEVVFEMAVIWVIVYLVFRFLRGTRGEGVIKGFAVLLVVVTLTILLISQVSDAFGRLNFLYEGAEISTWDKNLLMNLLWDLTSSSHAGRVSLFENVNGFPVPYLRERMVREYDRSAAVDHIRKFLGGRSDLERDADSNGDGK